MMNRRRALIGMTTSKHSRLPSGYRELEWIGVSGTQWISTNYAPTGYEPYRVEFKFRAENGICTVFGCRQSSSSGRNTLNFYGRNYDSYHNYGYGKFNTGSSSAFGVCNGDWDICTITQLLSQDMANIEINSTLYTISSSARGANTAYNIGIFALRRNGDGTAHQLSTNGSIAYLRFYDDQNNLVREYIPAERESDGERGMYELVTEGFLTNAGTGVFRKGGYV